MKPSRMTFEALFFGFALTLSANASPLPGIYDNAKGSPVLDLLHGAQSSIAMEIYEMDDPKVLSAIRAALNRGVRVHIVKEPDPVGAACKVFGNGGALKRSGEGAASCDNQQQLVDEVNQSGGKYVPFSKSAFCPSGASCLEHGKVLVVDSKLAMVTSGNFNTTNLCDLQFSPRTCNRDYSYVTADSDAVKSLENVIESDLQGQTYDLGSAITPVGSQELTIGPNSQAPLIAFIQSARKKIQVENQYLKDPVINDALIAAARSGVEVQITIASACSFGMPKPSEKRKLSAIFNAFDDAGISTRMFNKKMLVNGQPGYLHAKAIVVDGAKAWMGSVNGSTQATTRNREFGIFFSDPKDIQGLASVMSGDFADPNVESWQDSLECAENH